jgi:hypothetical protein
MLVEGHAPKRFAIYRLDLDGELYERVAEYDTIAEVRTHHRRPDWRYAVLVNGKRHTLAEFEEWAKTQQS